MRRRALSAAIGLCIALVAGCGRGALRTGPSSTTGSAVHAPAATPPRPRSGSKAAAKARHGRANAARRRAGDTRHARHYLSLSVSRVSKAVAYELAEVPCANSRVGWCTRMYRGRDAGRTWSRIHAPRLGANDEQGHLVFTSARVGWLIAGRYERPWKAWSTTNAGVSWHRLQLPAPTDIAATGGFVYFATHRAIYAHRLGQPGLRRAGPVVGTALAVSGNSVINYPRLDKTRAGIARMVVIHRSGVRIRRLPCRGQMSSALAETPDDQLLITCGGDAGTGEQLKRTYLSTSRQGRTWRRVHNPPVVGYVGLAATSSRGVFITGGRMPIYWTGDDGRTWHQAAAINPTTDGFDQIGYTDDQFGWATNAYDLNCLYFTNNAGRTWHRITAP